MLFAYASFALAFVLGITYVLLFKEIKARHLGFFYARLPSLQTLDAMNGRVVTIGWLFLTIGIAVGGIWATQIHTSTRSARAGDVGRATRRSWSRWCRWAVYSFALVRAAGDRLERPPRRLAVGDRLRDRALELRAGRLLLHEEPQLLEIRTTRMWKSGSTRQQMSTILCMRLFAVGISHRTAPVELRESVDFARRGLDAALTAFAARAASAREAVVLSTCNRAEIYALGRHRRGDPRHRAVLQRVPRRRSCEPGADHLYIYRGTDAARHLFRVAAGLDSLVVGEPQILGQVKSAYATASDLQVDRHGDPPPVPRRVRRRQARPQRDRARRRGGLGQLRRDRAGAGRSSATSRA